MNAPSSYPPTFPRKHCSPNAWKRVGGSHLFGSLRRSAMWGRPTGRRKTEDGRRQTGRSEHQPCQETVSLWLEPRWETRFHLESSPTVSTITNSCSRARTGACTLEHVDRRGVYPRKRLNQTPSSYAHRRPLISCTCRPAPPSSPTTRTAAKAPPHAYCRPARSTSPHAPEASCTLTHPLP